MLLMRQNPWSNFTTLRKEMDRFFNLPLADGLQQRSMSWMPRIDIQEVDEAYVITADLPGMSEDDIGVTVEGETVVITGARKADASREAKGWKHIERPVGKFQRTFHLPAAVNVNAVEAQYRNGVLTVNVPKAEDARTKRIAIQAA